MLHLRRPVGAIVGRTDEIRRLATGLDRARLLSLVGPGGVGKTALAAELAHEIEPDFDRLVTVELVDAERPDDPLRLVSSAVLGEPSTDPGPLITGLDAGRTVLVIDNCEHLIDDVAELVAMLLAGTERLTVLATSRRPLGLATETVWTVEPLAAPDESVEAGELVRYPAVQLFLERAYQAAPTFELTPINRPQVAQICRAADGVPLVLELAAALVRTTTLDEIIRAMTEPAAGMRSNRRDLPSHQRSIESSLEWSRRFLSDDDRRLLDRLSTFVGGFDAEAAIAVDPAATASALSRLCDHSLLTFDTTTGRYRMIEVIRLDAAGRLPGAEADELAERHLDWCASVVAEIDRARLAPDPDNRFPAFELELPNLCAGLRRCHERGDHRRFRSLLGPIALWWVHYLPPEDPDQWADLFAGEDTPLLWRANVTSALSFLASHRSHHQRALDLATEARALHARAGDVVGEALVITAIGNALVELGQRDAAGRAYRDGLAVALASEHPYAEMSLRVTLARFDPEAADADAHLQRAAELGDGIYGAIESITWAEQGQRALRRGDVRQAAELGQRALDRAMIAGYPEAVANALCGRADVAVAADEFDRADELYREALRVGRQAAHHGIVKRAEAGLAAAAAGLGGQAPPSGSTAVAVTGEALSERELAVARLLRGDLTQREIADELYIAPSTVKTHVTSIYRKLGVSKRSHAITRAAEIGLFDR